MATCSQSSWLACLLAIAASGVGSAAEALHAPEAPPESAAAVATIRARFATGYPDISITSIGPTSWANVYEVVTPEGIIYSDASGEYAMSGQIMATSSKENLTQARLSALTRVDFGSLPLASAIKVVKGTGSRTLVVFADPNCPYCRQLEEELQGVSDVTVYTFLFPLEELHPGARAHAEAIWCSKDPAQAWSQWMLKHVEPQAASCPTDALAALEKLGVKLNVIGTPTLIFGDGRRISGLIPQAQLEQELSRISPNKG